MGSSPAFLIPESLGFQCVLPWKEKWRSPAQPCCATPQCEHCWEWGKVSGQGHLCQMGTVRLGIGRTGHGQGLPECLAGSSHHAELHGHQHSMCSGSERASLAVLETCPSVQEPFGATAQPLWAQAPCTACTWSRKGQCIHRYCTKPRCKNSMSF